jgi:hypothetical protein
MKPKTKIWWVDFGDGETADRNGPFFECPCKMLGFVADCIGRGYGNIRINENQVTAKQLAKIKAIAAEWQGI